LRQAYDYWQDQPGFYRAPEPPAQSQRPEPATDTGSAPDSNTLSCALAKHAARDRPPQTQIHAGGDEKTT